MMNNLPIGKTQLACLFYPESAPDTARRRLMRAISRCKQLETAIADTGYNASSHEFSALQVKLIYYYLGDPDKAP